MMGGAPPRVSGTEEGHEVLGFSPLALFGGTFDPVHNDHLLMARLALEQIPLEGVLFIPAWMPPHKREAPMAPFSDRLQMLRLAVADDPRLDVSDIEARRGGYSFTVHTLRDLARARSERRIFYFVMGSDTLRELGTWKEPEGFAAMAHPLVIRREGFEPEPPAGLPVRFTVLEGGPCDLSGTGVRRAVEEGGGVDGMVPRPVADYIREKGLYRSGGRSGDA
jgi:nicotinate-nucleotide adenylyltransferase